MQAVNGVSFTVEKGETLGIVGESGCGKSVTMLSVLGLIQEPPGKIVAGEVIYQEEDLLELNDQTLQNVRGVELAMVFQDPMTSLNPVLTIGHQISEAQIFHFGISEEKSFERTIELLEQVGIPKARERYNDYPHQFSGGMRQRVMIAMALACSPNILIADEPTTALDVTIQAQIVELTKSIQEQMGMAVIWITHDLGVIAELADRVIVMYAGQIVEEASVFKIFENPAHPYTIALLQSLPRVDRSGDQRLSTIMGSPPDCIDMPDACPFVPRCHFAIERCSEENPQLEMIGERQKVACWIDVSTGSER
ncbi:ABC transporter ATP-binding protein [Chloroflexota bacterium]